MRQTSDASGRCGRAMAARTAAVGSLLVAVFLGFAGCSVNRHQHDVERLTAGPWLAEEIDGHGIAAGSECLLRVGTDGAVSGTVGCNRMTGRVAIDGHSLAFGHLVTTRMICGGLVMEQERRVLAALAAVRSFAIDGDELLLYGNGGAPLVRLSPRPPGR